jgi:hypothetical protein
MQTAVPEHGSSADRRKLGMRGLQTSVSEPGDGERGGGAIRLALRRFLDTFRRPIA